MGNCFTFSWREGAQDREKGALWRHCCALLTGIKGDMPAKQCVFDAHFARKTECLRLRGVESASTAVMPGTGISELGTGEAMNYIGCLQLLARV
jgi:hypothetical protein